MRNYWLGAIVSVVLFGTPLVAGCMIDPDAAPIDETAEIEGLDDSAHLGELDQSLRGTFQIMTRHSGMCLDITGASTSRGAAAIQWPCHGGNNQKFEFYDLRNGYHEIVAHHSGLCLDVEGASAGAGAKIIQWPCHGGTNQQFGIQYTDSGYLQIKARHSSQCFDIQGASGASGARLIQWPCHGGYNQQFSPR